MTVPHRNAPKSRRPAAKAVVLACCIGIFFAGTGKVFAYDPDLRPGDALPIVQPSSPVTTILRDKELFAASSQWTLKTAPSQLSGPAVPPAQTASPAATAVSPSTTQQAATVPAAAAQAAPNPSKSPPQAKTPEALPSPGTISAGLPSSSNGGSPTQPPTEFLTSAGILVDGLQYDIPMPWGQPLFEAYRKQYLTEGGKSWLESVMVRALPYMAYIQKKVEEFKVPKELMYLPVIESEFSPHAVSPSGAAGIWQFMRNSIAGYDIVINEWVDERRDFMKSTDAALQKLIENHDVLGDWLLAIAAYNAGLGAVQRAVQRAGSNADFWKLYANRDIPAEALNYVPQFLAIASILRYPELHGLPSNWGSDTRWESIPTQRQVDMSVLASKAQIPLDVLKLGNAELRYDITPPVDSYSVKVPVDKADSVKAILSDTKTPLIHYQIYKVKSGDTLSQIARRYGTPMNMILQTNPRLNPDRISIGQTIMIPYLGSSGSKSASPGSEKRPFSGNYVVKKGDTLWSISLDYNTQPEAIARENGLTMDSVINIGQHLKVPASN